MADQIEIDQLVDQIKSLVSALGETSKTGATKVDAANNKLIAAIGQLVISLNKSSKSTAASQKSMDRFLKEIDDAVKAQEEQTKVVEERKKAEEELNRAHEEALKLNTLSNEERKKQIAEDKKQSAFESLAAKTKADARSKEQKNWADVMNSMGSTATVGGLLKDKFEAMGGTSLGATAGLRLMSGVIEGVTAGLVEYGKAVYKGEIGAAGAAKGVKTFTNTLGTVAQALGGFLLLVPGAQALGVGLIAAGTAAKTFGEVTEELATVSDRLYNNYQDLSRVGVTAGDGMIGLADSARKLGYGIDEGEFGLKKFNALIGKSSQDLALLSGSALQGRLRLADIGEDFARGPFGRSLQNMGMSVDTINEGLVGYLALQSRVGQSQNKTVEQLRKGASAYLVEMDGLTKLTGIQRQELEDNINKARAIEQFRAKVDAMRATGDKDLIDRADQLERTYAVLAKQAPAYAQGFAESVTGIYRSKEAQQFLLTIEQGTGVVRKLTTQGIRAEEALGLIYGQAKITATQFRTLAEAGAFNEALGNYAQLSDLSARAGISMDEATKIIKEAQAKQQKGAEGATGAATDLRSQTMATRDAMQGLVLKGINPATEALGKLTGVVNKITGITPSAAAPTPSGAAPGGNRLGRAAARKRAEIAGIEQPGAAVPPGRRAEIAGIEQPGEAVPPGGSAARLKGAAAKNLNPGNLRFAGQAGATLGAGGFAKFETVDEGLVALANQINLYLTGKSASGQRDTVASLISVYAPPNENQTKDYIEKVAKFMGLKPDDKIGRDPATMAKLMTAIIGVENFGDPSKGYNYRSGVQASVAQVLGVDPSKIGKFRTGGIATGPSSGYVAQLHGTEAIIPMPNGQSIKVDMPDFSNSMSQQVQAMSAQITRLDELVSLMRNQNNISSKILQVSQA